MGPWREGPLCVGNKNSGSYTKPLIWCWTCALRCLWDNQEVLWRTLELRKLWITVIIWTYFAIVYKWTERKIREPRNSTTVKALHVLTLVRSLSTPMFPQPSPNIALGSPKHLQAVPGTSCTLQGSSSNASWNPALNIHLHWNTGPVGLNNLREVASKPRPTEHCLGERPHTPKKGNSEMCGTQRTYHIKCFGEDR